MSSSAESSKRPAQDNASSGKRRKSKGKAQPATSILELPDELKKDINEVLNEKQTRDEVGDQKDRFNRLKEVCDKLTKFDSSFRYTHFMKPDHEITNYMTEDDRILVRELGKETVRVYRHVHFKGRAMTLQAARNMVMTDESLNGPTRDPFDQNNPITYNGKAIHEFNKEELKKLSSDDAHEIINLMSKVLHHIATGLNTVPADVIVSVSTGMGLVLSYLDDQKSGFSLTEKEIAYIMVARRKFTEWKGTLSKRS